MVVMVREGNSERERRDEDIHQLRAEVKAGFARVDKDFAHVEKRFELVDKRFEQVDKNFERIDADIREVKVELREIRADTNSRFDSLQRTMILGFVSLFASIAASVIGVVLTTQL